MTLPTPNMASGAAVARESAVPEAESGPFVLNLCSSTTPMALAQVDLPELKRFTFFVSRRFEEGRERFRLHMGYFTTQAEAEEWLSVVRDIYPGAWAGEAPGKKLRARAAAAAAAQAQHAIGPQTRSVLPNLPPPAAAPVHAVPAQSAAPARPAPAPLAAAPVARPVELKPAVRVPAATAPAREPPGIHVPTLHAAAPAAVQGASRAATPSIPTAAIVKAAPSPVVAPVAKAARPQATPPVAKPAHAAAAPAARAQNPVAHPQHAKPAASAGAPTTAPRPNTANPAPAARMPAKPAVAPAPVAAKPRPKASTKGTAFADSNVREVLAALGDDTGETGQTRMMPALPRIEAQEDPALTDTQVLRYLESRRSDDGSARVEDAPDASISLLKPDDTGTRRALKEAVSQNAAVSFAVQLQWSVQPVELDKVPPLAIFSAYTLYTVEGSREGRKWYGLRLGFFSDAISAKQVAYYVRSEFASVAVVPVSPQERQRATDEDKKANASLAFPRKTRQNPIDEFKLSDPEEDAKSAQPAAKPAARPAAPKAAAPAAARSSAQPSVKRPTAQSGPSGASGKGGRVGARERKGPQTLEETLEILGAGELEIDNGRGELLNDAGVRHLRVEVQKNTPFSRLLERLSERTKKN